MRSFIFYILLVSLLVSCISFPLADAGLLEWKEQTSDDVIEIKSLLGTVAEIKLISNTDQCLGRCEAELEITTTKDVWATDNHFFEFRNVKDRYFDFKNEFYVLREETYEVPYEKSFEWCDVKNKNGSLEKCNFEYGTKKETKTSWEQVMLKDLEFKEGTTNIKLVGHKPINQDVDWVLNFYGEKLNEWAWWNSSWGRCKTINIAPPTATLSNFQRAINVTYDADMLVNFSDIRFINESCQNDGTELDFELDFKNDSVSALYWVEIDDFPTGANRTISMYYKNPTAADASTTATWGAYEGVYHFSNNDSKDSTAHGRNGSWSNTFPDWINASFGFGFDFGKDSTADKIALKTQFNMVNFNDSAISLWVTERGAWGERSGASDDYMYHFKQLSNFRANFL